MTRRAQLWELISAQLSLESWTSLQQIYRAVEDSGVLDAEDRDPQGPHSKGEKWKRNVRNALHHRKGTGQVSWDGHGGYKLNP